MKRILLIAALLFLSLTACALAEDTVYEADGYRYTLDVQGCATITRCPEDEDTLILPETLGGHPVTGLAEDALVTEQFLRTAIHIPASIVRIEGNPFMKRNVAEITLAPDHPAYAVIDGALVDTRDQTLVSCRINTEGDYAVAEGIRRIGDNAFFCNRTIINITLPESVTEIGDYAFAFCEQLESLNIPDGVTVLGDSAFCGCEKLSLRLSDTHPALIAVNHILYSRDMTVLFYCPASAGMTECAVPDGVVTISGSAFEGNAALERIILPKGIQSIGDRAFRQCASLKTVDLGESLKNLGASAFDECRELTEIRIPAGVTIIRRETFYGCAALQSVVFPDGIQSIERGAFYACASLRGIALPTGLTYIGDAAFGDCLSLEEIVIPDNVVFLGEEAFAVSSGLNTYPIFGGEPPFHSSALKSVEVGEGIVFLPFGAFMHHQALESVSLPGMLRMIDAYAFADCPALRELSVPASVEHIDGSAFKDTPDITLLVEKDSYAHKYAGENGIRYILLPGA